MGDMIKGNIAVAEAAVRAGIEVYAGYPITPSTEVMEYLSDRLPALGRTFIQAESELAAINMVLGVSACGRRVLTASSGRMPDSPSHSRNSIRSVSPYRSAVRRARSKGPCRRSETTAREITSRCSSQAGR